MTNYNLAAWTLLQAALVTFQVEASFYPMGKHNSCNKGVCRNHTDSCMAALFLTGQGIKQEPMPMWKLTFPKSVHHQNLVSTQPAVLYFRNPDDASHWEMCDFSMSMGSYYIVHCLSLIISLASEYTNIEMSCSISFGEFCHFQCVKVSLLQQIWVDCEGNHRCTRKVPVMKLEHAVLAKRQSASRHIKFETWQSVWNNWMN